MDIVADIARLARALDFYESRGYTRVELPWAVDAQAMRMTNPHIDGMARMNNRREDDFLVASAEQSFLFCEERGLLPPGKYCGLTPCFRPNDTGIYKQEGFYKVELYQTGDVTAITFAEFMSDAVNFVVQELPVRGPVLECHETPEQDVYISEIDLKTRWSRDINLNKIEIGSYGHRRSGQHEWLYGTGLAEPRFSIAKANT